MWCSTSGGLACSVMGVWLYLIVDSTEGLHVFRTPLFIGSADISPQGTRPLKLCCLFIFVCNPFKTCHLKTNVRSKRLFFFLTLQSLYQRDMIFKKLFWVFARFDECFACVWERFITEWTGTNNRVLFLVSERAEWFMSCCETWCWLYKTGGGWAGWGCVFRGWGGCSVCVYLCFGYLLAQCTSTVRTARLLLLL